MSQITQAEEVEHLRRQVRNLHSEMDLLLERNDDLLLLDVISEKLTLETSAQGVINTVVERVGSLSDLTYCAFISFGSGLGTVMSDWGPKLAGTLAGKSFPVAPDIGSALSHGTLSHPCPMLGELGPAIREAAAIEQDSSCCLIPVVVRSQVNALLCISPPQEETSLQKMQPVLRRAFSLVQTRLEAVSLLSELAELNKTLETKVEERTGELARSNALLKASEENLRESEERYRMLAEAAQDSIFILDRTGRFRYINRYGAAQFKSAPEEIIDQNLARFVPADTRNKLIRDIETVLRIGSPLFLQDKVNLGGREVWLDTVLVPLGLGGTNATSVLGVARDITWRRQSEELKVKLESQLYQSQKLEAVGRLAGGVTHDFNNLLTAVLGYSDLALKRLLPEDPLRKEIVEIRRAAERATVLTRQLLAFSRKQVLQSKVFDLGEVVSDLTQMLERLLGDDIILDMRCEPGTGSVVADPAQIQQVVLNLAINARDAMPDGGTLSIQTERVQLGKDPVSLDFPGHPGGHVLLTVSDTGCGMDLETQSHLFEPFYTTKPPEKGSGLGLATVHGIITQSGGHIEVYSEPGRGTVVRILLPEYQGAVESDEDKIDQAARGNETILVVEDSIQVRALSRRILTSYGYRVLDAADGPAAMEVSKRERGRIHLLLTDVVMPGMNGSALAALLTELRPDMKVVYMSGYTDDEVIRRLALDATCNFIPKPFRPEVLALKLREVLDKN
jgi:PAS domain S-box-containing protein